MPHASHARDIITETLPMTDPALIAALEADPPSGSAIIEAAATALAVSRPAASRADVHTFGAALSYWATDGDPPPGAPANKGLELWLFRVLDRVDPRDAQAAVDLVDALVFLPRPGSADADVIREVIDLLDATKSTFKSRQIARAKQLLLPLVP